MGRVDVDDMLANISSRQLSEWIAFFELEPFGYKSTLHGNAIVATVLANINRKKGARSFKPDDFLPTEVKQVKDNFFASLKRFFGVKR